VILEERGGSRHEIHADIVIGADGLRSAVARHVEAPVSRQGRHACGVVYAFWRGVGADETRWHYRPGVSVGVIPTNDDASCIFVATAAAEFRDRFQSDMEAGYRRRLSDCVPALGEELAGRSPVERFRGFPGNPGVIRRSHGPGWALVGDAGYFKDPITAHGITDALRDAEFLARAVSRASDRALAEYQSSRDELSRELFDVTDMVAAFDWDLETLKTLHLRLSRAMNAEVEALLALDGAKEAPPT
jgi:flavin-dependent dehydrogenase